jgi:hypothetical protein
MVTRSESAETWLINLPASPRQSRIGFLVAIVLIAGLGATAPFADMPLPRIDAFIPTVEVAVIITDLITAVLLFSLVRIYHSRAVLALACGYLFTALIVIPHVLTFPGAFAPAGLLGRSLQSTGWLYTFWHLGFPLGMLIYACLKQEELRPNQSGVKRVWGSLEPCNRNYFGLWAYMACDKCRPISATRIFRRYAPCSIFALYPYIRDADLCRRPCVGVAKAMLGT